MTDGVLAQIALRLMATDTKSAVPFAPAVQTVSELFGVSLNPGTGIGNADTMFTKALNIAASGSVTLDLAGSLVDFSGATVAFAEIQAMILVADAANVNNIVLGDAASDPWVGPFDAGTDTMGVKPGGILMWADPAGWPVVATTGDQLKLANSSSGSGVTGKLILIGRSA